MAREGARGEEKSRIALAARYGFTPSARGFSPFRWRRWSWRGQIGESAVEALLVENATSIRHPHRTNGVSAIGEADAFSLSLSLSYFPSASRVLPSVPRPRNYIPWAPGAPRSSAIRVERSWCRAHTRLANEDAMLFHVHILGERYSRWKCTSRARPSLRSRRSTVQTCTPSNDAIVACQVRAVLSPRAGARAELLGKEMEPVLEGSPGNTANTAGGIFHGKTCTSSGHRVL